MSIFNPWLILTLILSLIGAFGAGHHSGYSAKEAEDQAEILRINTQMNSDKDQADAKLFKANQALAAAQTQLHNAIRAGDQRLYVNVRSPIGCSSSASGDATERAELEPATAEALVSITDQGDNAIVQLNSCIARYNQVREAIRGKR